MALVSVIRRWHLREGMPIREIARRTGLSRNTVRKYLAIQSADQRLTAEPPQSPLFSGLLHFWGYRNSDWETGCQVQNRPFFSNGVFASH